MGYGVIFGWRFRSLVVTFASSKTTATRTRIGQRKGRNRSDAAVCSNEQGVGGCVHSTNKSKGWPIGVGRGDAVVCRMSSVGIEGEKTIGQGSEWSKWARMWEKMRQDRYCLQTDRPTKMTLADVN